MNKLKDVVAYIYENYPYKDELSKSRLVKLVYLSDWFGAVIYDEPLTTTDWIFNHYGPYVDKVINSLQGDPCFSINSTHNGYGASKYLISYCGGRKINLKPQERELIDAVINKTRGMYYNEFIDYVYSTYPVQVSNRYSKLNLIQLAQEYNNRNPTN